MENLKEFNIEQNMFKKIRKGAFGQVYRITPLHVGKFISDLDSELPQNSLYYRDLEKESNIAKIVYNKGISIPKPEGVFNIKLPSNGKIIPAFVMEYIEGLTLKQIIYKENNNSLLYRNILDLAKKEVRKVKKEGIIPIDSDSPGNIMWDPKKEKVYLIDFGMWRICK